MNQWLITRQVDSLNFRPASNYAGSIVFTYAVTNNWGINSQAVSFVVPVGSPLPVTLLDFQAVGRGVNALLTWHTASELHNNRFVVERSFDGQQFVAAVTLPSKGTAATYIFTDDNVGLRATGPVFYRLQHVDDDGTSRYSPVRAVVVNSPALLVQVYPNPVADELHTALPVPGASLTVYTSTGQAVLRARTDTTEVTLSLQDLPNGSYLLLVQPD